MNQIFNFHRFRLLLQLDLSENGKSYLLTGGLLIGMLFMFMFPITLSKQYSEILIVLHLLALAMVVIFGGSFYTIYAFNKFATTDTGIAALMIPASRLEKYLSALLLNLMLTVPLLLIFIQLHYWTLDVANSGLSPEISKYKPIPRGILQYLISLHLIVQGAMFLGSIYFSKLAYIKTAALLIVIALASETVSWLFGYYATSKPTNIVTFPFISWRIWYKETGKNYYVDYPETVQYMVYSFPILLLLALWYISYVRLCEKEI